MTRVQNDGLIIFGAAIFGIITSETPIGPAIGLALAIADLLQYRQGVSGPPSNAKVATSSNAGPFHLFGGRVNPSDPFSTNRPGPGSAYGGK